MRRYDAGTGRFISKDKVRGFIESPFTMNHYEYCWNRPLNLVDLNGMAPTAGVIKDIYANMEGENSSEDNFWNTYILGVEESVSETQTEVSNPIAGVFHSLTTEEVIPSEKYTGKVLKRKDSISEKGARSAYSINLPVYNAGDNNKFGIPISLGVYGGSGEVGINGSIGIDIGKFNINIPINIGLGWEDWLSASASINAGWGDDAIGLDASAGLSPYSNLKISGHHTLTEGNKTTTNKWGMHMKTGVAYVLIVAVGVAYQTYVTGDSASGVQVLTQYWNSLAGGVCPGLE